MGTYIYVGFVYLNRERTCWSVYQYMPTQTLCIRPKILKRVNSYELVVQKIVYLAKGRQMLQEYQANRYHIPSVVFVFSEATDI